MSKLKPYDKYQPVQYDYVAEVPQGWKLLPNIAIFEERIERGFIDEELLSVTIGRGVIRQTDVDIKKDSSNEDKSKYKLIKVGDIAYNRMRMWQGALGYSDYRGITSPAYVILKPKMKINQRFFHYMFRTRFYTNYSKRFSYGIVDDQLSLRYVDFKRMYTIVPTLETQNEIVTYLDRKTKKTREFIQRKKRLIELLEEEKKNLIDTAYIQGLDPNTEYQSTGKDWITEIPEGWTLLPLKYLTRVISKGTTPSTEGQGMTDEGIRYIKAENIFYSELVDTPAFFINENTHKILSRSQLKENDILFVIAGATIGKVAMVSSSKLPANTNQAVSFIRLKKKIDVEYCFYWLQSSFVHTITWLTAVQSAQPNLAMEDLGNILIPIPNNDEEKNQIVAYIIDEHKKLNALITSANSEIEKAKEFEESLITQVVTGQLKVPTLTPEKVLN